LCRITSTVTRLREDQSVRRCALGDVADDRGELLWS
jgi:hypothetical protein